MDFADVPRALAAFQQFGRRLERRIAWEESSLFPAMALSLFSIQESPSVSCRGCCASQRPGLGLRASGALDPTEMRCPACGIATLARAGEDHIHIRNALDSVIQALRDGDAVAAERQALSLREALDSHHVIEARSLRPATILSGKARALSQASMFKRA